MPPRKRKAAAVSTSATQPATASGSENFTQKLNDIVLATQEIDPDFRPIERLYLTELLKELHHVLASGVESSSILSHPELAEAVQKALSKSSETSAEAVPEETAEPPPKRVARGRKKKEPVPEEAVTEANAPTQAGPSTDVAEQAAEPEPAPAKKKGRKGKAKAEPESNTAEQGDALPAEEKRLRRWRDHAPESVRDRIYRCNTQRMFVIGRERVEGADPPEEKFQMAGSTGNVYTVYIKKIPECNCPDGKKHGGTCKHILYVMIKVLRAPAELQYQLALTSSELREIFAKAPPPPASENSTSNQKPLDSDDCPICYYALEPNQDIVFCRAQCGSNFHRDCFNQWKTSKQGGQVTCVMCRTPWQDGPPEDLQKALETAKKGKEGYLNVGDQLGLSSSRSGNYHYKGFYRRRWR